MLMKCLDHALCFGSRGVVKRENPMHAAPPADVYERVPWSRHRRQFLWNGPPEGLHERARPHRAEHTIDLPGHTGARVGSNFHRRQDAHFIEMALLGYRARNGVLRTRGKSRRAVQQVLFIGAISCNVYRLQFSLSECSRLIERDPSYPRQLLKHAATADQYSAPRRLTDAECGSQRRGQAQ